MRKHRDARGRSGVYRALCVALSVLFPPLGVFLTLRTRWPSNVKLALTGLAVASAVAIVLMLPTPDARVNGGVEMVGAKKDAEIYGPPLPTAMVTGYTAPLTGSVFANPTEDPGETVTYVYALPGAKYYHLYDCHYNYDGAQKLTLYEAHFMSYSPCANCNPPVYTPGTLP